VIFSRAMKAVDPSIHLGANGHTSKDSRGKADGEDGPIWWQTVLEKPRRYRFSGGASLPLLEMGQLRLLHRSHPDFTEAADEALGPGGMGPAACQPHPRTGHRNQRRRLGRQRALPRLTGWPLVNDLGHALVLFEILGQHLLHPRVDQAQVWNTRWVNPAEKQLWNTLDENNQFNATGHAVAIWGQHLLEEMVEATSDGSVRCFASCDPERRAFNLFVINKALSNQTVALTISGPDQSWTGEWWALTGSSPEDPAPEFKHMGGVEANNSSLLLDLPPVSISVIKRKPLDE
jgi:alpha-L-arabinofuranosidase